MPSMDTLLVERRSAVRAGVVGQEISEPAPPPVDPPDVDGGGDDDNGHGGDGLWFDSFLVAFVEAAPAEPSRESPRDLYPAVAIRVGAGDPRVAGPLLTALQVIANAAPDEAECWQCGGTVGWTAVAVTGELAEGGEMLEWQPVALVASVDPGDCPVNPFCEGCAPFVAPVPMNPQGAVVSAGGWLGELDRCVRSPDGSRVVHLHVGEAERCVCGGTVVPD